MNWHYVLEDKQHGPVNAEDFKQLVQQQVIQSQTLVWSEGMTEWKPYSSLQTISTLNPVTPPTTETTAACRACGSAFPEQEMLRYENSWICASCKPTFFQKVKEGVSLSHLNLASIGQRFGAVILDGIIVNIVTYIPLLLFLGVDGLMNKTNPSLTTTIFQLVWTYGLIFFYYIFFVGRLGGTPGKLALGLRVVRPDGGSVSYMRAAGRLLSTWISALILCIGYLMAFWDEEKRTLHDRICDTRVIRIK
jgi:uncharacterized RDD family membrane protein YckC